MRKALLLVPLVGACINPAGDPSVTVYPDELVVEDLRPDGGSVPMVTLAIVNENEYTVRLGALSVQGPASQYLRSDEGRGGGGLASRGTFRVEFEVPSAEEVPRLSWENGVHEGEVSVIVTGTTRVDTSGNPDLTSAFELEIPVPVRVSVDCDFDKDGIEAPECGGPDCDDEEDDIFPGAEEVCDGIDNNCDTVVDEGC